MCKHGWYGGGIYFVRQHSLWANTSALEWVVSQHAVLTMSCQHQLNEVRQNKHTMNWSDKHVLLKWKDRNSLLTWNRTRELEKGIRSLCFRTRWHLKFRFQHGPFARRFGPMVTRVPPVMLSISHFFRLTVTRAWIFALYKLIEETGTYSHLSELSVSCMRVSVFTASPGAHICLKCAYVFTPPVGYSGSCFQL